MQHDKILILDFGSQVTQLIARRVREAHVYSEVHPCDVSDAWVREYAADPRHQGQTMGAVASLNSLMAVMAPVLGTALLGVVSHRPAGDVMIGLPFFVCAALQLSAAVIAWRFFRGHREVHAATH